MVRNFRSRGLLGAVLDSREEVARCLDRLVDVGLRIDETAQLNRTLEGLDVDLGRLQRRFSEYGRLHLGGNDGVVDLLASAFCLRCACATGNGGERKGQEECGKTSADLFHG
jgi:hypothetical protein